MLGMKRLVACVVLMFAAANTTQAGIMVSGYPTGTSVSVELSGTLTARSLQQNINTIVLSRSVTGGSSVLLQASFGSIKEGNTVLSQISKIQFTSSTVTLITNQTFNVPQGSVITLSGISGGRAASGNINSLGPSGTLSSASAFSASLPLTITPLVGNPPSVVPEPASLVIWGLMGTVMIPVLRRRRR